MNADYCAREQAMLQAIVGIVIAIGALVFFFWMMRARRRDRRQTS
jgi:hypothetical protein